MPCWSRIIFTMLWLKNEKQNIFQIFNQAILSFLNITKWMTPGEKGTKIRFFSPDYNSLRPGNSSHLADHNLSIRGIIPKFLFPSMNDDILTSGILQDGQQYCLLSFADGDRTTRALEQSLLKLLLHTRLSIGPKAERVLFISFSDIAFCDVKADKKPSNITWTSKYQEKKFQHSSIGFRVKWRFALC